MPGRTTPRLSTAMDTQGGINRTRGALMLHAARREGKQVNVRAWARFRQADFTGAISQNAVSGPRVKLDAYDAGGGVVSCSGMAPQLRIAWRELHRPLWIGNPNA